MNPAYASVAAHFPAVAQRGLLSNPMDVTEANVGRYRKSFAKMVEFVGMMHRGDTAGGRNRRLAGLHAPP